MSTVAWPPVLVFLSLCRNELSSNKQRFFVAFGVILLGNVYLDNWFWNILLRTRTHTHTHTHTHMHTYIYTHRHRNTHAERQFLPAWFGQFAAQGTCRGKKPDTRSAAALSAAPPSANPLSAAAVAPSASLPRRSASPPSAAAARRRPPMMMHKRLLAPKSKSLE